MEVPLKKNTIRIAATITLTFRLIFATILLLAAKETDTEFLKWTLLVIVSTMSTYGVWRFVKMLGFAKNFDKMEKVFDLKN